MKKKKIQLKNLQVTSFITALNADEEQEIRGGGLTRPNTNQGSVTPNLGRKYMWTISEQRLRGMNVFDGRKGKYKAEG